MKKVYVRSFGEVEQRDKSEKIHVTLMKKVCEKLYTRVARSQPNVSDVAAHKVNTESRKFTKVVNSQKKSLRPFFAVFQRQIEYQFVSSNCSIGKMT